MTLIADSGSTKTTWMEVESGNKVVTEGLNPHFTSDEQFLAACSLVRQKFSILNLFLRRRLRQRGTKGAGEGTAV